MPRAAMPAPFPASDLSGEVVCPLQNQDGSTCRKRCLGDKRYRSMQEHIRRAHPDYYIPKLPATEESFYLMVNTPPTERPEPQMQLPSPQIGQSMHSAMGQTLLPPLSHPGLRHISQSFPNERFSTFPDPSRNLLDDYSRGDNVLAPISHSASAASALAQLHTHRMDSDWDSEPDTSFSDSERRIPRSSIELPPILGDLASPLNLSRQREALPSLLNSPPGRSSTLPPFQPSLAPGMPRKMSVSKRGREPYHQKKRSRGSGADALRRIDDRLRPGLHDRKALSAEPSADLGKRWEDLIVAADQAASAAGDLNEERTPVSSWHPTLVPFTPPLTVSLSLSPLTSAQVPQSPALTHGASPPPRVPVTSHPQVQGAYGHGDDYHHHDRKHQHHQRPQHHHHPHRYLHHQASPSRSDQALTPPTYAQEPYPSVESNGSAGSAGMSTIHGGSGSTTNNNHHHHNHHPTGDTFHHMAPRNILSVSSPNFSFQNTQIYCAACQGASYLRDSFACTECICGLCQACVDVLLAEQGARRQCPRCFTIGGKFKPFQLDIR